MCIEAVHNTLKDFLLLLFQKILIKMVLNKRDLERAFSPNKHRRSGGQRRSLNKFNKGGRTGSQTSSSVRVVVRVRPQNAKEMENNARYDCLTFHTKDATS